MRSGVELFKRETAPLTAWQIVVWWELRRIPYNLLIGVTGLVTCTIMFSVAVICERLIGVPVGMPDPPVIAVLAVAAYGVMANVCFTGGWVLELLLVRMGGIPSNRFAPIAFGLGLFGSVCLTLLPALITVISAAIQLSLHAD